MSGSSGDSGGISPVAGRASNRLKYFGIGAVLLASAAIVFLPGGDDSDATTDLTKGEEEDFSFGHIKADMPVPPPELGALPVHTPATITKFNSSKYDAELARMRAELKALKKSRRATAGSSADDAAAALLARRSTSGIVLDDTIDPVGSIALAGPEEKTTDDALVKPVSADVIQDISKVILQGKTIAGYLETAIQSDLAGAVRAVVSRDVYSYDASTLLVPRGSRLVGMYRSGITTGQTRLFVIWERIITPEGVSINIKAPATDEIGRSGLTGKVVTHFWKRFGSAMFVTILGTTLAREIEDKDNQGNDAIAESVSRQAEIALQHNLSIPPTINIPQGAAVNVHVRQDIDFSDALEKYATKTAGAAHVIEYISIR